MIEIKKIIYKCNFCEFEHEDKTFTSIHEECCALNPKNQPCSMCSNLILGVGCSKNMDMENVGGKVLCFYYKKGIPKNPFDGLIRIDGNDIDGDE